MTYPQDTPPVTPDMQQIDPQRTTADDYAALKARITQLEAEAEARDAAQRRQQELENAGLASGGEPVEHFNQLADGRFVRTFGIATHIADGDKPPMPVVASYVVPAGYDANYANVGR
jgi:hypothetical protein